MISRWWHTTVLGHLVRHSRVSAPSWDMGARGYLWVCSCDRTWAR